MVTHRFARAGVLSALLAAAPALAAAPRLTEDVAHGYYVYADVVEVSPRYGWHQVSEPVRRCVEVVEPYHAGTGRHDHRHVDRYDDHGYRDDGYRPDRPGSHHQRHSGSEAAAGLVGGLIGGLIGNQFGGGDGKRALTVVGALVGASVATDRVRRHRETSTFRYGPQAGFGHPVRRCTETAQSRRVRGVTGYDVTYRYQGERFHKFLDEHPGDAVRVHVAVEPVD